MRPALRFLALGDSYTIGEGVARRASAGRRNSWRDCAVKGLIWAIRACSPPPAGPPTNWPVPAGAALRPTLRPGQPGHRRQQSVPRPRCGELPQRVRCPARSRHRPGRRSATQRVLVVSIPDWGVTRFWAASGRDVAQIARASWTPSMRSTARRAAAVTCTGRTCARPRAAPALRPDMLAEDGLHPSSASTRSG